MNSFNSIVTFKREDFRIQIRKETLEDLFKQKRRQYTNDFNKIQIPNFNSSQELHNYLIEGEFKHQKLASAANNSQLLQKLIQSGLNYDYYSILILGNICAVQFIDVDNVFLNILQISEQRDDIKMIACCLNGIESYCSNLMPKPKFYHLLEINLISQVNQIIKQNIHDVYTDEEFLIMKYGSGILGRFLHQISQFEVDEQKKIIGKITPDIKFSFFLMKELLPQLKQSKNGNLMFLKNILQLMMLESTLVEQLDNTSIQLCVKFLETTQDQILILVILRLFIYLSSLENEKFTQRIFLLNGHEPIKQYMEHENPIIRLASIKTLANFANSETESLKKKLVEDNSFIISVMQDFSQSNQINCEQLRLIYGIIYNCYPYISEEFIKDINTYQILKNKFMFESELKPEEILYLLKIMITLLEDYKIYQNPDEKEFEIKIEKLLNSKNEAINLLASNLLEYMKNE